MQFNILEGKSIAIDISMILRFGIIYFSESIINVLSFVPKTNILLHVVNIFKTTRDKYTKNTLLKYSKI